MRIKNPNFEGDIKKLIRENRAAFVAWFNAPAQIAKEYITTAEIRAAFPTIAAKLTDGVIAEFAKDQGLTVDNE